MGGVDSGAPDRPGRETLRSVLRALDVLRELAAHPAGATPKTLSAALSPHLSTTYPRVNRRDRAWPGTTVPGLRSIPAAMTWTAPPARLLLA